MKDYMPEYRALHKKIAEIEDLMDKKGIQYPKRCHSCADHLKQTEIYFCDECAEIMKKELAKGNIYVGGNVKRQDRKKIHYE